MLKVCVRESVRPLYDEIPRPSTVRIPCVPYTPTTTVLAVSIEFVSNEKVRVFVLSRATRVLIPVICR